QFGRVRRVLTWAQFQNGLARPLGGSLQMDDMPSSAPPDTGAPPPNNAPAPSTSTPTPTSQPTRY
ncbi:MAG: hypothetical protein M3Y93_01815, partial [Pseudomonadota bacterium]|nr:hypothetical protein [Pseudomonadota bacterium]